MKIFRSIRLWWQRRTRGWDESDWWSLDITISKFVLPRLKEFRDKTISHPSDTSMTEWRSILDDMIYAHEYKANQFSDEFEHENWDWSRVKRGFELFGQYYRDLWD